MASILDIILRTKSEGKGAAETKSSLAGVKDAFENLTGVSLGATAAIGAVVGALKFSIQEAIDAERETAQLNAVLESTGGAAGMSADEITNLAMELSRLSGVDDGVIVSAESVLLTFTKIGKEVFPDATLAALNMSMALGQDLQSSVIQIGKALNDPIQGITALQRVGVSFTDSQRDMVAAMVEAGDVMGAQKFILQELETEFGGVAEAAGDTLAGKMANLENTVRILASSVGEKLIPVLSDAADALLVLATASSTISDAFEDHEDDVRSTADSYVDYATEMGRAGVVAGKLWDEQAALIEQYAAGADMTENEIIAIEKLLVARGILTKDEFNEIQTRLLLNESFEATAAAMQYTEEATGNLAATTEEAAQAQLDFDAGLMDSSTNSLPAYQVSLMRAREEAERLADVGSAVVNANTNIASSIDTLIGKIEFYKAGGVELQKTYEAVEGAIEAGKITPEEGEAFLEGLRVAAANLLIELGEQTPEQAAQGLADSLGITLEDAAALIQNFTDQDLTALQAALGEAVGDPAIVGNLQAFNDALGAMDLETAATDMTNLVQPATDFSTVVSETLAPALSAANDSMGSFTGELQTFADTLTVELIDGLNDLANTLTTDVNPEIETMYSLMNQEFNPALDDSTGLLDDFIVGLEGAAGAFVGFSESAGSGVELLAELATNLANIPDNKTVTFVANVGTAIADIQRLLDKINQIPNQVTIDIITDGGGTDPGGCFDAKTPVTMADGSTKPISEVQAGDMVLSYDPKAGVFHPGRVTATMHRYNPVRLHLRLDNGTLLVTTASHPFYLPGSHYGYHVDFIAAGELTTGDELTVVNGDRLEKVKVNQILTMRGDQVYNLTIDPSHTYLAAGVIVHNDKPVSFLNGGLGSMPGGGIGSVTIQNVNINGGVNSNPQQLWNQFKAALDAEVVQARQSGIGTRGDT